MALELLSGCADADSEQTQVGAHGDGPVPAPVSGGAPEAPPMPCSPVVFADPQLEVAVREATPVHGQFLEKGTFNMGERCGEWIENGGTGAYDPCPPGLEDGN